MVKRLPEGQVDLPYTPRNNSDGDQIVYWDLRNATVSKNKVIMLNRTVSMSTHNVIIKRGYTYKNNHISPATHPSI